MIVGIPREIKQGEKRVGMTPDGVAGLTQKGHQVLLENNAGLGSGFSNEEYLQAGAKIIGHSAELWASSELIVKVKEPLKEEFPHFRKGLAIFSYFHPVTAPEMTKELVAKAVTGISYDLLTLEDGRLPLLEPMSIVAGKLAIQCGAYALQSSSGGCGILLGGCVGVKPGKVVVIGAGFAGSNAAKVALGIGAEVTILDVNTQRLAPFADGYSKVRTLHSTPRAIARELQNADLVIGSVLVPGALAPKLITKEMLSQMRPGTVLVDICIDQGGCAETSRPTSISEPTYIECGVVHYCVPNMPALVPRTSTEALTNQTSYWVELMARYGIQNSLSSNKTLLSALFSFDGKLTNSVIGKELEMPYIENSQAVNLMR